MPIVNNRVESGEVVAKDLLEVAVAGIETDIANIQTADSEETKAIIKRILLILRYMHALR